MAKPNKIHEIEIREGKPIIQILREHYRRYGKQIDVARALGVSQTTVSLWLMRLGLEEKSILVPRSSRKNSHQYPTQPVEE